MFVFKNGDVYEGDFVNVELRGQNGDVYEGNFVNGLFEGTGKITYTDGGHYDG